MKSLKSNILRIILLPDNLDATSEQKLRKLKD
jgi:hypothetical protein